MTYKAETEITAPAERIFELIGDFGRHSEWAAHQLRIEAEGDGAMSVGAKFRSLGHQMGRDVPNQLTVTEYSPPNRLVFEADGQEGTFRHGFELRPSGDRTRVTKTLDVVRASLPTKLLAPLFAIIGPRGLAADLRRLKAKLELSS